MGDGIVGRAEETDLSGMKSHTAELNHQQICCVFHESGAGSHRTLHPWPQSGSCPSCCFS